jgi:hypothetical protein
MSLFDGLSEELGNFVTSEVNYLALFCLNSSSAKSVLAGEKLVATYSIFT